MTIWTVFCTYLDGKLETVSAVPGRHALYIDQVRTDVEPHGVFIEADTAQEAMDSIPRIR